MTPNDSGDECMEDAPTNGPPSGFDSGSRKSFGLPDSEEMESEPIQSHRFSVPEGEIRPSTPIPTEAGKEILQPDYTVSRSSPSGFRPTPSVLTDHQIVVLTKDVIVERPELLKQLGHSNYRAILSDHCSCFRRLHAFPLLTFAW